MAYLVYKHTSPSGKSYIGFTGDYEARCQSHSTGTNSCTAFAAAVRKYGWDAFTHEILLDGLTEEEALIQEPLLIAEHQTMTPYGYNLTSGGECCTQSEEVRQKKSEALKGRARPAHIAEALRTINIGRRHTEETKQAMSEARRGVPKDKPARISSWVVTSPEGVKYSIEGLKPFCEEHGLVFTLMRKVAAGKAEHHKGWKCQRT